MKRINIKDMQLKEKWDTVVRLARRHSREPLAIMKKELMSFFYTPIAYIVITAFLVVTGFFFFKDFFYFNQAEMRGFFQFLPLVLTLVVPAITMRLFAEEMHTGTIEIMMTLPVRTIDAVAGKFLAATLFVTMMMVPTLAYLVTILIVGSPDPGPIIGGYVGSILLAGTYSAVGILSSSLSRNQIIAFIGGLVACFFLWLVDKITMFLPAGLRFLEYLGTDYHFRNVSRGIIDSRDIIYFLSIIVIALLVTAKILDDRR